MLSVIQTGVYYKEDGNP